MELKPVNESSKAIYPTREKAPKGDLAKKVILPLAAISITPDPMPVAVPFGNTTRSIASLVRVVFSATTVLSFLLLIIDTIKMKKGTNQDTKTIKKHTKIEWILLIISVIAVIGLTIALNTIIEKR